MIYPTPDNSTPFAGRRIGLLGGSFNPAHDGHLAISLYACVKLQLDGIWWLVSPQNPLKSASDMAPLDQRLQQARELAAPHPEITVTDIESQLGTHFTIDSLTQIRAHFSSTRFVWLMGADNLHQMPQWHRWQEIFTLMPIAVFRRAGYAENYEQFPEQSEAAKHFAASRIGIGRAGQLADCPPPAWLVLDNDLNPLSARAIRNEHNPHS